MTDVTRNGQFLDVKIEVVNIFPNACIDLDGHWNCQRNGYYCIQSGGDLL